MYYRLFRRKSLSLPPPVPAHALPRVGVPSNAKASANARANKFAQIKLLTDWLKKFKKMDKKGEDSPKTPAE